MPKFPKTKVMVFGTFDVLHKGHLNFFKQARNLAKNPFLVVSLARDINVKKIKGQKPRYKERVRLNRVAKSILVDKALLGGFRNHLPHILKERPKIIALGYDQTVYAKNLAVDLAKKGLKVRLIRLKPYHPRIYKSSVIKVDGG